MLHVYGIIDGGRLLGAVPRGHEGEKVAAFPVGNMAAIVSQAASGGIEAAVAPYNER